jgi:Zn-dependent protease with chaperone function
LGLSAARLDAVWWLAVPLLVTMLVLMPLAVRRIWRTEALERGPLRQEIERICQTRRCAVRDILVWHTGGTMANAAAVGMSRWLRFILISDVLLARLTAWQIAAVVRHELAHLRRWHLPLRLAMLLLPVSAWLAAKSIWPQLPSAGVALAASWGPVGGLVTIAAMPLAMLTYAVVVVGWYSRLLEHDADLDACLDDAGQFDADAASSFATALAALSGRGDEGRLSRWMHPSLVERLRFIEHLARQPVAIAAYRRRLRRIAALMISAYAAGAATILAA